MAFTSYSDWVGANAGNEANVTAAALSKAQAGNDPNAVGNAAKAGQAGQAQPSGNASYGDFLKSLQGDPASAAVALGGGATPFDAMLMQGSQGDQLKQAQQAYDQQQAGANSAYATGQKNANTAGAAAAQNAANASQFNAGQGHMTPEQAKAAQKASLDAGAQYRLGRERAQYEADRASNANRDQWISNVLNPIGGIGWGLSKSAPSYTDVAKFGGHLQDPFGIGGNAHSGFGPGGAFGSPGGMGGSGDPVGGQYDSGDAGFQEWLKKTGYDPTTGNGNGY
jgi:hypothetical protein